MTQQCSYVNRCWLTPNNNNRQDNKIKNISTGQNTFNKRERLKSRKTIEHLFSKGKSTSAFPLKVLYDFVEAAEAPLRCGVTVSSRKFRKAVQRNRIKRVLRETYRLQKTHLITALAHQGKAMVIFFIYTGKELPVYAEVYEKMGLILVRLKEVIENNIDKE